MPLSSGTRLGPYEILAPLGAGGMGEVYRGRDTRLERSVAIKVLPSHLSATPELKVRLEREARTISSLNHPHICTLHDVGHENGVDYLVMELIEGETLADRVAKGPLPTEQLLRIGIEIADALDRAHKSGVIHRDLKPGNIMLTKSGAKLMDFGLARADGLGEAPTSMSQSPTRTTPLTSAGTIIGTFQYMAPEQLEGGTVDARTDLWAFGCVLYEMATGRRAFEGKSQASLIGNIMNTEPPSIATVVPLCPPALDRVIRGLLTKDPDERISTAHDVRLQLQWIRDAGSQAGVPAPIAARRKSRERTAWSLAVAASIVAIAALAIPRIGPAPVIPRAMRFAITEPPGLTLNNDGPQVALSPDGRLLATQMIDSTGAAFIFVRPLEALQPRRIQGTDNATFAFWSPDSKHLGFFANGKLRKVPVDGGPSEVLCEAPDARGGSWSKDGVIVFAPMASGPIMKVSEEGGEPALLYAPDSTRKETGFRWPEFLPDGKHFMFVSLPARQGNFDVTVGSVDARPRKNLLASAAAPIYAPPGWVLFVRNGRHMAQRFDAGSLALRGKPQAIGEAPPLSNTAGARAATMSATGVLAHPAAGVVNTRAIWLDRSGREAGSVPLPEGRWEGMSLSPDDQWMVIGRRPSPNEQDLWTVDLARGLASRFTFNTSSNVNLPTWSPDGQWVAYNSDLRGPFDIYRKRLGGSEEELVYASSALFKNLNDWSPDGRYLLFEQPDPQTGWDVWMLPVDGDRKPVPAVRTRFNERSGDISPDGRWLSYYSDESGKDEVYVQSFPTPDRKHQVSTAGGSFAFWSSTGKEIIYFGADFSAMSVAVETAPTFKAGVPRPIFKARTDIIGFASTSDFSRFIATVPVGSSAPASITVTVNWAAGLAK